MTFGFAKTGLLLYPGKYYAGNLVVADIGFPQASLLKAGWDAKLITPDDLSWLPKRQPDGNKGTFGETITSLVKTIIGIHAGNLVISTNIVIAAKTSILSANGSKNFPKVVI